MQVPRAANDVIRKVDIGNREALAVMQPFATDDRLLDVFNASQQLYNLLSCSFEYLHSHARAIEVGLLPSSAM
ncbi:protein of unknown function [Thauera humireducens]|nr:protein of unknown function [Thauera humireducens]